MDQLPDPTGADVYITITDVINGDVFKCRVDNIIGFDTESTTVHVEYGKYVCHIYTYLSGIHMCISYI